MDSDHINYLIYRYLQESGFQHSSFVFGQESGVTRSSVGSIYGTKIPPGSLILQLQRALNYVQVGLPAGRGGAPVFAREMGAGTAAGPSDALGKPHAGAKRVSSR